MSSMAQLQLAMPEGMDAAILVSEHNRRYFTGFASSDGLLFVTRERACLLVDFRYFEAAQAQAQDCEVVELTDRRKQLVRLACECGIRTAGVEAKELPLAEFNTFQADLPDVEFDKSNTLSNLISNLKMIKRPFEIERIRKAQEITDAAFSHILPYIKPGACEQDLALEIEYFMRKNGAKGPSFDLIVIAGRKTSLPHGVPGDYRIQNGDFITMDTGAVYEGYCSDMTRTVAVGGADTDMRRVYDTVLKAQLSALSRLRAGAVCSDVDRTARGLIDSAGYGGCFGHGLGHGVGLQIHEEPRLSPLCGTILREGMVVTVEPGIYLSGRFGVRIEDLVLIKSGGVENLTKSPKELIVL